MSFCDTVKELMETKLLRYGSKDWQREQARHGEADCGQRGRVKTRGSAGVYRRLAGADVEAEEACLEALRGWVSWDRVASERKRSDEEIQSV